MNWDPRLPKCPVSREDRGEFLKPKSKEVGWDNVRGIAPGATGDLSSEEFVRQQRDEWPDRSGEVTMTEDRFRRIYAVEIEFDTPFDFAEQDRLACVVLEKLVDGYWSDAAEGTPQGNVPIKVIAYPIPNPRGQHDDGKDGAGLQQTFTSSAD